MTGKKYYLIFSWFVIALFLSLSMTYTMAEDLDTAVWMEDATGKPLPMARSQKSGRYLSSYLADFSYESQFTDEQEKVIYEALEKTLAAETYEDGTTHLLLERYHTGNRLEITLARRVTFQGSVTKDNYTRDPSYMNLKNAVAKATHAFLKDHNQLFWCSHFKFGISPTDLEKGYIEKIRVYPVDYYSGIRDEISETNARLTAFARNVSGDTRFEKVKKIHDYICNLITYPKTDINNDIYHTIPCAWLDTYSHLGVCEAYSKSFAYACELAGIEALSITGGSRIESNGYIFATHMWNYVKMEDGLWYLVDCTWDDSNNIQSYRYFLSGSDSAGKNHFPVGNFSTDTTYIPFSYPVLSTKDYPILKEVQVEKVPEIDEGNKGSLTLSFEPVNAKAGLEFLYESSDEKIAKVDAQGNITGVAPGRASITITSKAFPFITADCEITINEHEFLIEKGTVAPNCTEDGKITYACTHMGCTSLKEIPVPADGETHEISQNWVTDRNATCLEEGLSVRRCIRCDKVLEEKSIPKVEAKVYLNGTSMLIQINRTSTKLVIKKKDPLDSVESWTSSNPNVVAVSKTTGKLTAKKLGSSVIKVKMKSGATASCRVTVKKSVKCRELILSKSKVTLKKKQTYKIGVTKKPVNSVDKLYYKSNNTGIATVSAKGLVTARKAGTATITVFTASGIKARLKVVVK